jgi:hypothetical protein
LESFEIKLEYIKNWQLRKLKQTMC